MTSKKNIVTVEDPTGAEQPCEIEVKPSDTVSGVIEEACKIRGIEPKNFSLAKGGEILPSNVTMKNVGLRDGGALMLMPKDPQGGASPIPLPLSVLAALAAPTTAAVLEQRLSREDQWIKKAGIPLRRTEPRQWTGTVQANRGKWAGQQLSIRIAIPPNYPAVQPIVRFLDLPKPMHPNITRSWVCLNILGDSWSPQHNIVGVHRALAWLLEHPNHEHPNNMEAIRQRSGPEAFASLLRRNIFG